GESFVTCTPFAPLAEASATQTLPSLSTAMACGSTKRSAPKFLSVLPSGPISKMDLQPASSQRSAAQKLLLASTVTAFTGAKRRGICAQFSTSRYGLGRSFAQG